MISLQALLLEKMTFNDLLRASDSNRKDKARGMDVRSLRVNSERDGESSVFSYKSNPSSTGKRYQGYIKFLKSDLSSSKSKDDIYCIVDCNCPDYKYQFAYNNARQGASVIGNKSFNKNNGGTPLPIHRHIGLCKHLISLAKYLKTKIDSKRNLKECICGSDVISELMTECDNKLVIIKEGVIIDWAKKRLIELETEIRTLEAKWDDLDSKSLNTYGIQKKLENRKKELDNIKTVLDLQK